MIRWPEAMDAISSIQAARVYVVLFALSLLGLALRQSLKIKQSLDEIGDEYFAIRRRGRKAKLQKTRDLHWEQDRARRRVLIWQVWRQVAALLLLGVMLPTALLVLGTEYYGWFDASAVPLVDANSAQPILQPTPFEVATYILDNVLRGGLFDLMEVFKLKTTTVSNNAQAYPYSVGLFLYHLYVEGFFVFGLVYIGRFTILARKQTRKAEAQRAAEAMAYPGTTGEPLAVAA